MSHYELRCRECGRSWGNQPRNICDECFSPLEIAYDYDAVRAQGTFSRERISQRPPNMWRYSELLPLPPGFRSDECFSPLEIAYDYDAVRAQGTFSRERISQRPPNMWRYSELLPLPPGF